MTGFARCRPADIFPGAMLWHRHGDEGQPRPVTIQPAGPRGQCRAQFTTAGGRPYVDAINPVNLYRQTAA